MTAPERFAKKSDSSCNAGANGMDPAHAGEVKSRTSTASGSNLTFESRQGFPADSIRASLAHANWNLHYSQAR